MMSNGQVKWFNNAKGFGFILPEDGGADLFAHYSSIGMEGYKTLKAGQNVTFDLVTGPKGPHAANIMLAEGEIPAAPPKGAEHEATAANADAPMTESAEAPAQAAN